MATFYLEGTGSPRMYSLRLPKLALYTVLGVEAMPPKVCTVVLAASRLAFAARSSATFAPALSTKERAGPFGPTLS